MPKLKTKKPRINYEGCISNWIARLNQLYGEICGWLKEHPGWSSAITEIPQRREEILERAKIAPRSVPVLTLVKDQSTLQFVPRALWVIGGNGQVDVVDRERVYILVDCADDKTDARDWQIVIPEDKRIVLPFDKKALSLLLRDR
jgi:hypothetical protein